MDAWAFHNELLELGDSLQWLIIASPPPAALVEELEGGLYVAGELESNAVATLGGLSAGELAVSVIEEAALFRFVAQRSVDGVKRHWPEHPSNDPYWDRCEHPEVVAELTRYEWPAGLYRLACRVKGYLAVFGGEILADAGGKLKPDAETLAAIELIKSGVTDTNVLCKRTGKSAQNIRTIKSRLRRGRYET